MTHKFQVMALLAGGVLLIAGEALANSAPSPDKGVGSSLAIDLGERDFRSYCAACHGVDGRGDGTIAEFLTIAAPDLTKLTKLNAGQFPRERVIEVIDGRVEVRVHGARDMPVWGDWFNAEAASVDTDAEARALIVRERIDALVSYIATLQEN